MLSNIWNIILESNTFNFVVFAAIFLFIFKKINLKERLINIQQQTENEVNSSKKAKKESQSSLNKAELKIKKVDKAIEKIIADSKDTAETMANNIISSANERIETINNNAKKIIDNDVYKFKKSLSDFVIKKSLEQTKSDIIDETNKNFELHQKYIEEAINELEGINF